MNLTEQQPNTSVRRAQEKPRIKKKYKKQIDRGAKNTLFQNLCEPKFRFVETNIFQELRKFSQDGNAMDHRYLVLLMGNEIKIVAWRKFALAGNRTQASA